MARSKKQTNGATIGFEEKLWAAADKMRGHMDPAEYKHVALGLIFLKYINDAFAEKEAALIAEGDAEWAQAAEREQEEARQASLRAGASRQEAERVAAAAAERLRESWVGSVDPEERDEYTAENVFWVPREARWSSLQAKAKQPEVGSLIDAAMIAIEKENPQLKGVLSKDYARPALDKQQLGELIDLISTISMGDAESRSKDVLGRVYEYFLGRFASAEGKGGGEFYTARCVVKLLVEMIEPFKGRVYDPCCGSGGMFVQSERFVEQHGGRKGDIAIYGQESNPTTWRLCKMNLAIRGLEGDIGGHLGPSLKAGEQREQVTSSRSSADSPLQLPARNTGMAASAVKRNVTKDWSLRESARARTRVMIKRQLRKYGYPPDKQEKSTVLVMQQAEVLSEDWGA